MAPIKIHILFLHNEMSPCNLSDMSFKSGTASCFLVGADAVRVTVSDKQEMAKAGRAYAACSGDVT